MKCLQHARYGLLYSLELSFILEQSISIDFIIKFLLLNGCSHIWLVVDHFIKIAHCIPLKYDI
jgi:hypothetical protein